jgi:hypothetical protein
VRATQVAQFTRDAGHLYAYGIDFTQAAAQQMLVKLAPVLNFALSGGTGEVIFATVLMVGPDDCTAGGLQANTGSCPNLNQAVYTRWYRVGNKTVYSSRFGSPTTADTTSGIVNSTSYLRDSTARVSGVSGVMTLAASQRGATLILLTLALSLVVIPLMGIAVDGTTLYLVRIKLSQAVTRQRWAVPDR